jgi:hypothetical protein
LLVGEVCQSGVGGTRGGGFLSNRLALLLHPHHLLLFQHIEDAPAVSLLRELPSLHEPQRTRAARDEAH